MKRKGFTLIELLAVIIIVGIITLIAMPMIFNVMEDSGSATFKQTLNNIVDSAKIYKTREEKSNPIRDCRYFSFGDDVSEVTVRDTKTYYPVKDLEVKGKLPTEGELEICIDKISLVANDDEYCGIYDDGSGVNVIDCTLSENKVSVPIIDIFNATTTTNKIIISISAHNSDPSSDIANYYYKIDDGEYQKTPNSSYIFDELRPDERHTIYVKVENDLGITAEDSKIVTTKDFGTLEIAVKDIGKWTPSKEVTLSGNTNDYQIEYRIKKYNFETNEEEFSDDFITYSAPFELNSIATKEHPITVYARFNDGYNVTEEQTMKITMIDPTPPDLSLGYIFKTATSIEIPFSPSDAESGINETICVYGTSESYEQNGIINGNTCTLNGLTEGVKYYYKIETINNSRLSTKKENTVTTGIPTINYDIEQTPTNTSYAQSKKVKVSYSAPIIDNPTYYVATSVQTTSTTDLYGCTGDTTGTPSNCSDDSYPAGTKLSAGRWYMIKGTSDETHINFTSNGTIYNLIHDGETVVLSDTLDINKIDTTAPSVEIGTTTKTTTSVTIPFTISDEESGISKKTCVYGTSSSYGKTGVISDNKCTLAGLTKGTKYYYKIEATNNSGLSTKKELTVATGSTSVGFDITKTPTDTTYAQSKAVTLTYTISNVTSPVRYVKTSVATTSSVNGYACGNDPDPGTCSSTATKSFAAGYWYKVTSNPVVTFKADGTLYARINDGAIYSTAETRNVSGIDPTPPELTLSTPTTTTKSITIPFTAEDLESGISGTTCVYGTSTSYGKTGTISGNKCILSNLTAGTKYYYKVTTTNNSGLSTPATGSATAGSTSIKFDIAQTPTDTTYAQSKAVTVTYTISNVTSSVRYVKTSVATTSSINGYACGNGTDPGTCSSTATKSFAAGYWYKVTSNPVVTFKSDGTLYARINDGAIYSTSETLNVNKIDTTAPSTTKPTVAQSTSNAKALVVTNKQTDAQSDISSVKYGYSTSSDGEYTWKDSNTFSGLTAGTTYYFKTKSTNNSGLESISAYASGKISFTGVPNCTYSAGDKVSYFNNEWLVITNYDKTVKLIKGYNISKGAFDTGGSNEYKDSTAYTTINTWFNSVSTLKKDLAAGAIITDSNGYYVRLPYKSEVTTAIPSSGGTPFWTMTKNAVSYFTAVTSWYHKDDYNEVVVALKDGTVAVNRYHFTQYGLETIKSGAGTTLKQQQGWGTETKVYSSVSSTLPENTTLILPTKSSSTEFYSTSLDLKTSSSTAQRYICDYSKGPTSVLVSSGVKYAPGDNTYCTKKAIYKITDTNYGEIGYRPVITVRKNPDTACPQ